MKKTIYNKNISNGVQLREKFSDFSANLETEVTSLLETRLKRWKDKNLPISEMQVTTFNELNSFSSASSLITNKRLNVGSRQNTVLPSREFISRPSLLSELLTISHIKSIYNIFVAILLILLIHKVLEDFVKLGRINFGFSFITWAFGSFDKVFIIWICMKLSTLIIVYIFYHLWAHHRQRSKRFYDVCASLLYLFYIVLFIQLPIQSLLRYNLPPASSIIILCEQIRMFMKTWAFVRTNITKTLMFKKDESISCLCPNFSQYLYFLFAPTLIYRDTYPRNEHCNWKKVAIDFLQVFGCILYIHFLFATFCIPVFQNFGKESFSQVQLIVSIFSSCFPGWCCLLCSFFALLHAWMNAFAEMVKFADRMFYKDWWNSTSYPRFYRTWNCIVHDWLYEYVYKELSEWQASLNGGIIAKMKYFPMLAVFFISSVVHEYILALAFRFFYPVLLVMFGGFGLLFMFINTKKRAFNIFLWFSLILGTGIIMCLYCLEWYARINCPQTLDGYIDYLVPRSWFCQYT